MRYDINYYRALKLSGELRRIDAKQGVALGHITEKEFKELFPGKRKHRPKNYGYMPQERENGEWW